MTRDTPAADSPVIDCQVHAYERDRPERPWRAVLTGPTQVTGADVIREMDANRVDGSILISPYTIYGYDPSYALSVYDQYPDRFALVRPFDPHSETVAQEIEEWAALPAAVGARVVLSFEDVDPDTPGLNAIIQTAAQAGLPVNLLCSTKLPLFAEIARRHPDAQLVIDHLGLPQPFDPPPPDEPWADLDRVLSLAQFDHVAIKISGACTLAREPFPYPDIWAPLARIFEAYGFDRCMWGTDWTRAVNLLSFAQGVEAFRLTDTLSDDERAALMGGTLQRIYGWSPGRPA